MPNWMRSLWKETHPEMVKRNKIRGIFQSFGSRCAVERLRRTVQCKRSVGVELDERAQEREQIRRRQAELALPAPIYHQTTARSITLKLWCAPAAASMAAAK